MNKHNQERLSALADGELKGFSRWLTQRHIRRCGSCAAQYRRLEQLREALALCLPTAQMSDSEDFFWSKVQRQIEAEGRKSVSLPMPRLTIGDWLLVHRGALAGVASALVAAVGVWFQLQIGQLTGRGDVIVECVDTVIPNTVATPLKGKDADVAVIWVSGLDWTPDLEQMRKHFDDIES